MRTLRNLLILSVVLIILAENDNVYKQLTSGSRPIQSTPQPQLGIIRRSIRGIIYYSKQFWKWLY